MHKFDILVEATLVDKGFAPLKTYRDDRVAWEIAEVLALHFRGLLKERVQQSPFLASWLMKQWTIQQLNNLFYT